MTTAPHLFVALTAHGFGHAAMTAPVLNRVAARIHSLKLTIRSDHPRALLEGLIAHPFTQLPGSDDFGLKMRSARAIDLEASLAAYRSLHDRLDDAIDQQKQTLIDHGATLVLANIGYIPLLAARAAHIPAIALSCLNWADIYGYYFRDTPEGPAVLRSMREGYRSARRFLGTAPCMAMPDLPNFQAIGPVARKAALAREAVRDALGLAKGTKFGLIAFGGLEFDLPLARWPRLPGWRWVAHGDVSGHPDMIALADCALPFTELLAASDLAIGKPGYGTFAEAAVNGTKLLFIPRPDWPESQVMTDWLSANGRCAEIAPEALFDGDALQGALTALLSLPAQAPVEPSGVEEATDIIVEALLTP